MSMSGQTLKRFILTMWYVNSNAYQIALKVWGFYINYVICKWWSYGKYAISTN